MNAEHYNELIGLSQKIYEYAADTLTNYCSAKYCGVGNDTAEQQMEDHLIVFAEGENEVNESIEASSGTKRQQDPLRRPRSRKDIPPS